MLSDTTAPDIKEILTSARGYVAKGWAQFAMARDAAGQPVRVDSPRACRWCLTGAIQYAACGRPVGLILEHVLAVAGFNCVSNLPGLNDSVITSQGEALALLDKAIAALSDAAS